MNRRTALYASHVASGAKMSPFGGFDMPLQYPGGIIAEHGAARHAAAVFDTCHMGEFSVRGPGAVAGLERALSCDIANMRVGSCRYGFMCNDAGGVVDDLIVYREAGDGFMLVVNAGTAAGDFEWLAERLPEGARLEDISEATAKIDLNGPASPKIAAALLGDAVAGLKYYGFARGRYRGAEVLVSRTGYTGEIGFEFYCGVDVIVGLWDDCVARGAVPAGLGARDALRLEMGYPLYGHELTAERNAAQAGFTRALSAKKDFIGSAAVFGPSAAKQLLCGISIEGRRAARHGDVLLGSGGVEIGTVTSGSFSPSLGHAVALAYVDREFSEMGTEVRVDTGGRGEVCGRVCELPFYRGATARDDINRYL